MIKLFSDLLKNSPEQYNKICSELLKHPEAGSFVCRFSFGELVKTAAFLDENSWSVNADVVLKRFYAFEAFLIQSILSVGNNEAKLQGRERLARTAVQRTVRQVAHIQSTMKDRAELERLSAKIAQKGQGKSNGRSEWDDLQEIFA